MANYSKINLRFSNFGANTAHDPTTLPFGKYALLTNCITDIEGQLTTRSGLTALSSASTAGNQSIIGFRRLNDSIRGFSTYVVRAGTTLDCTVNATTGQVITTNPFTFLSDVSAPLGIGFSNIFGSLAIERTARSNQTWAYVGDTAKMVKTGINAAQGMDIKNVGISRPVGPPSLVGVSGGQLTLLGTYFYRFTLYDNDTGVESLFQSIPWVSTGADATITLTGDQQTVNVTLTAETVDGAVTHARIYRKGGTLAVWNLVDKVPYTGAPITYVDSTADLAISSSLILDELSDKPFTCTDDVGDDIPGTPLPYLFGPVNGYILACGDPNNTGYVYWANKFNPDSQNPNNRVEVSSPQDPVVNGFVYDGKAYVFTKEGLYYLILGLGTSTWTPFKTSCGHGLFAPHAFCVGPEVYYLGKDGIYATSGGAERSLTGDELRPLFQGETVSGYSPVDYSQPQQHFMIYHSNELWFEYLAQDGTRHFLTYSLLYKRWSFHAFVVGVSSLYDDEDVTPIAHANASRLMLGSGSTDSKLYLYDGTTDAGTAIPAEVTTGIITLDAPLIHKEWGALIFDTNPNGNSINVGVYTNKGTVLAISSTITSASRTRTVINLNDLFAEDIQIDLRWSSTAVAPVLYGYEILYRADTVQLTRWSIINTDHGVQGWQILRSAYFVCRTDGTLNVAITPDGGTTYNYTIPSTGGDRLKTFIPFNPIKGKLFTYVISLGTATYFRLYNEDCEVHVKPWVTSLGYTRANPFVGGDGGQQSGLQQQQGNTAGPGVNQIGGGGSSDSGSVDPFNTDAFNFLGAGGSPFVPPGSPQGPATQVGGSGSTGGGGSHAAPPTVSLPN